MSGLPNCPKCSSTYTYEDQESYVCPECAHTWPMQEAAAVEAARVIRDAHGNVLEDGDTVTVGKLTLDVRHCPGHTPGHVVFHHPESKLAIVGDVLFQGSIGRTDFPMGNHQDLIDAITQKLWPLGEDVTFVPGHGPTSTFGQERKTNAYVSDYALS